MKVLKWLVAGAAMLSFGLSSALAADKAKQDEVLKASQAALADFYKADPKLKGLVEKAPGYATFTTFGISFLVGGAGGKGVVHDKATKKNTFMDLAQASAGLQIGASDMRYLFIFDTPASMQQFIDKGWDASAAAAAGAGATGISECKHRCLYRWQVLSADEERLAGGRGCQRHQGLEGQGPELAPRRTACRH
jgi:lipid-binding SYLF domain-containing protein